MTKRRRVRSETHWTKNRGREKAPHTKRRKERGSKREWVSHVRTTLGEGGRADIWHQPDAPVHSRPAAEQSGEHQRRRQPKDSTPRTHASKTDNSRYREVVEPRVREQTPSKTNGGL